MDRRSSPRCPVCAGPGLEDAAAPDGVRCRRSTCIHNHAHVKCPRCGKQDLESVSYEKDVFTFTCKECTHAFKA